MNARAASILLHLPIEPHHMVGYGEHRKIAHPQDPPFEAATALWSLKTYGPALEVTVCDPTCTDGRGLLEYDLDDLPAWLPVPDPTFISAAEALLMGVSK